MDDVFGGLAGGPSGQPPQVLDELERALQGAALLGAELDSRYRVLAVTLEPQPDRPLRVPVDDRRVQLLCFPVSVILASLRRQDEETPELLAFTQEQLPDVVRTIAGAPVRAPLFGRPEPTVGSWGPRFSLEGRSTTSDGVSRTVTLEVEDAGLHFSMFARFDDVELRDAHGTPLET